MELVNYPPGLQTLCALGLAYTDPSCALWPRLTRLRSPPLRWPCLRNATSSPASPRAAALDAELVLARVTQGNVSPSAGRARKGFLQLAFHGPALYRRPHAGQEGLRRPKETPTWTTCSPQLRCMAPENDNHAPLTFTARALLIKGEKDFLVQKLAFKNSPMRSTTGPIELRKKWRGQKPKGYDLCHSMDYCIVFAWF